MHMHINVYNCLINQFFVCYSTASNDGRKILAPPATLKWICGKHGWLALAKQIEVR